jgi:hypothetical protein
MIRRFPWRKVFLGLLCLVPAGCEPRHSFLRPKKDGDDMMALAADSEKDSDSGKIIGGSSDDKDASSFFQKNRRSGAWSSEAREIESHLGAN